MSKLLHDFSTLKGISDANRSFILSAGRVPSCWQRLSRHPAIREREAFKAQPGQLAFTAQGTIFLGILTSGNGQRKLVVIDVVPSFTNSTHPLIAARTITPGNLKTPPIVSRQLFNFGAYGDTWYREGLLIYPAHVDPHNESKCEAVYSYIIGVPETGGEKVVEEKLICELQDDGSIKLSTGRNKLIQEHEWPDTYIID